jgi:SAM-dependent methyltransferase
MAEARHDRPPEEPGAALRYWADTFDRLAAVSPEGGSALYGLGSPALLQRATDEIVARIREWGLVGRDRDALEIGCGVGRIVRALAPLMRRVVGTDISAGMVAAASRRSQANASYLVGSGRDLAPFSDASFDIVLAVDVFPYLVQAGGDLARRHVEEAARVLRPGGRLLVLNLSYRGDSDLDRRDMAQMLEGARLTSERAGTRDFALWDGVTFLARKPERPTL